MKYSYLIILFVVIASVFLFSMVRRAATVEDTIGANIVDMAVNPVNGNLAIPTSSDVDGSSKIEITDGNLNILNSINLNSWDYSLFCSYSNDGSKLYVCIAHMPNWENVDIETEDGKLLVIDTATWNMTYHDLPYYPMRIYVSSQPGIVYLTCGHYNGPILMKFNALTGQTINSVNDYTFTMFESGGLCMNQDETKLYVDGSTRDCMDVNENAYRYSRLMIYDSDLNYIAEKMIAPEITEIINAPNSLIYISHSDYMPPWDDTIGNDTVLTVLNSLTDEVEYEFVLPGTGSGMIKLDPARNIMYLSIATLQEYYSEVLDRNLETLLPTNLVMNLNLNDWSYTWIEIAPETVCPIALSPDCSRLYAAAVNTDSQKVYYEDIF